MLLWTAGHNSHPSQQHPIECCVRLDHCEHCCVNSHNNIHNNHNNIPLNVVKTWPFLTLWWTLLWLVTTTFPGITTTFHWMLWQPDRCECYGESQQHSHESQQQSIECSGDLTVVNVMVNVVVNAAGHNSHPS